MGNAMSGIQNYKQTVVNLTTDLRSLYDICGEMGLEASQHAVDEVARRLAEDTFNVAIVGEFKRGKSTLINALLEQPILPSDVLPCSAALNRVTYGIDPHATIRYRDGRTEDVPVDRLEDYVTKLTPESEERAANVESATVYYPISFCKNGVTIIDTPGLNDDEAMTEVTLSVLPESDAAIMVMMCGSPFSESEREFLEQKIMAADLGRVIFVVTGIDRYDEEEQEKLLGLFRRRITESVLNKARSVYGEDSEEYATYQRKLGSIKIYPVSARDALRAKMKNDAAKLAESRFPEFEEGLMQFLVHDRGALQLSAPANRARSTVAEILKAAELRVSALGMAQEEFDAKYAEAMQQMESVRTARTEEMQKVSAAADEAYQQLAPAVASYWSDLEQAACQVVDNYELKNVKATKDEATLDALNKAVVGAMQAQAQLFAERTQATLERALADEAERLGGFEEYFFDAAAHIQGGFVDDALADSQSGLSTGVGGAAFTILGIALAGSMIGSMGSSAYMGYKDAGWKGLLLGGGVGTVTSATVAAGILSAAAAAGVTALAAPVALGVFAVAGAVGGLASRGAVNAAFKNKKLDEFRQQYKDAIHGQLVRMSQEEDFPARVRAQVDELFDALKNRVVTETETVLGNTEAQLQDLRAERISGETSREQERERLQVVVERATSIGQRATELTGELAGILAAQA